MQRKVKYLCQNVQIFIVRSKNIYSLFVISKNKLEITITSLFNVFIYF